MKNNLLDEKSSYSGQQRLRTTIDLCRYSPEQFEIRRDVALSELPGPGEGAGITWVHVCGLAASETVSGVCALFCIDALAVQDILNVNHPSKIEEKEKYNVVISKLFVRDEGVQAAIVQGDGFVLTFVETEETGLFDEVVGGIRSNAFRIRSRQSDYLLTVVLNGIAANHLAEINRIDASMDDLESQLLASANDKSLGARIQSLRRDYLRVKQTVLPLKEQYPKLLRSESPLIHKANRAFFNDVNDHILNVSQKVEICRETLASLVDLYIANNDLRMNDIMKRLTVVSTIFIPLTFLAGVWGMNFEQMPELSWKWGYPSAIGLMGLIGVSVYLFLRSKKWN